MYTIHYIIYTVTHAQRPSNVVQPMDQDYGIYKKGTQETPDSVIVVQVRT